MANSIPTMEESLEELQKLRDYYGKIAPEAEDMCDRREKKIRETNGRITATDLRLALMLDYGPMPDQEG